MRMNLFLPTRTTAGSSRNILMAVIAVLVIGFAGYRILNFSSQGKVEYPYWCQSCKEVYSVQEIREPGKWRSVPGMSDSVVFCIRCEKGMAYPAVPCETCGTLHLLHIFPKTDCPTCHPEVEKAARSQGIDLTPPELD